MNVDYLQLFVRVAALNNISTAGQELGLSPAVASAHLNKLEKNLGVRLVHRTTRKVSLTEEGLAFLPHANDVLESIETAKASVGMGSICPQGKLRIAAPASFGRMHLVPALAQFLRRYPDIKVDLYLSDKVVDMVEGGFDISIRDAYLNDSSLIARKLAKVKRVICASPAYLEEFGVPSCPEDLKHHHCVNLIGLDKWQFISEQGKQVIKTQNRLLVDNGEAARDACIEGLGITTSSTWCCYQALKTGQLVEVLKDYPLAENTSLWAVYPSSRLLAAKVRVFIDYFSELFSQNTPWQ